MNQDLVTEYQREAARIVEDSIHSAKGHYNAADRWKKIHLWIGIPNAALAAVAGISAFEGCELLAGCLAIAVAAITAINTFLNPGDRSSTHLHCAGEYHSLRNQARIFNNISLHLCSSLDEMNSTFHAMADKRNNLNATAPQIPEWAFKKAKAGIGAGEATYKE